ncbi:hypothetical protein [Cereibacter sphaeroides]|uniref:hypothetical protein n=1 Tax=Cereibacter sphaeroides TaxID=1063 RepID=UPI001FD21E0A|nr:hypothetical protein [Cereibacter sphaeroides]
MAAKWLSRALTTEDDVMACGERSRLRHLIKCCCAAVLAGGIFPLAAHAQVTAPKMTSAAALLDWLATQTEVDAKATRVRLSETGTICVVGQYTRVDRSLKEYGVDVSDKTNVPENNVAIVLINGSEVSTALHRQNKLIFHYLGCWEASRIEIELEPFSALDTGFINVWIRPDLR